MKEIRQTWIEKQRALSEAAEAEKDSQSVAFHLLETYDCLSPEERESVHSVLAEWLISEDDRLRYDAAFLISQRKIQSLRLAIEQAIRSLQSRSDVETQFEIKKLHRIVEDLH